MSLEKEIQNHNNKTCQDSATNLPSFTAPSHQGELKEEEEKKLGWEQLRQAREFRQTSCFISLPARVRQSCKTLYFLCFARQSKLNYTKLTGPLISETQRRVDFLIHYS